MIPEEKNAAVSRGLREAFGATAFQEIRKMTSGLSSALVFRIVVRGAPYLLRVSTRTDAMGDPTHQFTCMRAAAEAGLGPRVWYTSLEDRISIVDFVDSVPFPIGEALVQVPVVLRTLHALPRFPSAMNYATINHGFIRRFQVANVLPEEQIKEGFARYAELAAVYPRQETDIVSCHNDLKPENILFDGARAWLVAWEAGLLNDRYFDLAIVANFVVSSHADERTYLHHYFEQPADEYQLARFFLMRQVMHMFYAAMFLFLGSAGKPVDERENAPGFREIHQQIWEGEINLADDDRKIIYGRVHWREFLQNTRQERYRRALAIVSDRHPRSEGARLLLGSV